MPRQPAGGALLGHGRFFGDCDQRREAGGLVFASLVPRVPEREVDRHTHEEAHFVDVRAGTYLSSAAGAPEVAPPPTLIYNPPGTTHRDRFHSARGRFFTISIDRATLRALSDRAALPERAVWLGHPGALGAVARLRRECDTWDDVSPIQIDSLMWTLVDAVGRATAQGDDGAPWLLRARDRLRDECAGPIGLGSLAATAGVHPGHLTRSFRRAFGCTPGAYQRLCRVERAAGLVRTSREPLAEVAARCGFSDQSHLTRALRRHLGVTPARWRRR